MTTRDEVLAMAEQADIIYVGVDGKAIANCDSGSDITEEVMRFHALAVEKEREECAKVCEQIAGPDGLNPPGKPKSFYYTDDGYGCAGAIRARSAK